jgi:transmembrane sensor
MKGNGYSGERTPEEDTAAAWYVANQLREDDVDDRTIRRWGDWYDQPENRSRYDSIVELGRLAPDLPRPTQVRADELRDDIAQMSLFAHETESASPSRFWRLRSVPSRITTYTAAAAVVLSLAVIGLITLLQHQQAVSSGAYATAPGEQRSFKLEDGSQITLGGDTSIEVRFSRSGRLVVLSRGEGMFRVEHDVDRPFSVCAASGCTTAVGTVFDVRLYSGYARVWVQEGAVVVTKSKGGTDSEATAVRVEPSQEVTYQDGGTMSEASVVDAALAAAWTHGSLVYYGRPLGDVLEDVQRYTSRRLVVAPEIKRQLYSGSVLQAHIEEWLRGLARIFPIRVVDCRNLQESIGSEVEDVTRSCASDPNRVLIRY